MTPREMDEGDVGKLVQITAQELELRVGTALANAMTDEQLAEFEQFIDRNADALAWMEKNLPQYKAVVRQTAEALLNELRYEIRRITLTRPDLRVAGGTQ